MSEGLSEFIGTVVFILLASAIVIVFGHGVISCTQKEKAMQCFKDTQDKRCWELKP